MTTAKSPTKGKRFSPVAFTAPTAEEPIRQGGMASEGTELTTPGRPAFKPASSHEAMASLSPEAVTESSQDAPASRGQESTAESSHAVVAPRRPEAETPRGHEAKAERGPEAETARRISFSWRLTPEQSDRLDALILDLRCQVGSGRLGRSEFLHALVDVLRDRPDFQAELVKRLKDA